MTTLREAAEIALAALSHPNFQGAEEAETILRDALWRSKSSSKLREALAQPEPGPVAWMIYTLDGASVCVTDSPSDFTSEYRALPIYATPPQRKPLTVEQLLDIREHQRLLEELGPVWAPMLYYFCQAIERAHGIGGEE